MPQTIALVVFENILRYSTGTDDPRAALAAAFDEPTEVFSEILRPSWFKQSSGLRHKHGRTCKFWRGKVKKPIVMVLRANV